MTTKLPKTKKKKIRVQIVGGPPFLKGMAGTLIGFEITDPPYRANIDLGQMGVLNMPLEHVKAIK